MQKLAQDFGIDPDKPPAAAALPKPERPLLKAYRQEEVRCLRVLCDYLHLLESWKVQYAPKTPEDALDDRFVELLAVSSTVGAAQITAEDSTAATITSPDGILSIEMPGDEWKEKEDSDFWFEITDGNNSIVIDHLSNGEMLPDIKMAGEENEEVSG